MLEPSSLIEQNLGLVFSERVSLKRTRAIRTLWADQAVYRTYEAAHVGPLALAASVERVLWQYPEYSFFALSKADEILGAARLHWGFGVQGMKPAFTGWDMIEVEHGRIKTLFRFLDGPAF